MNEKTKTVISVSAEDLKMAVKQIEKMDGFPELRSLLTSKAMEDFSDDQVRDEFNRRLREGRYDVEHEC